MLFFHTVHEVLKTRILKRFAIPFCSGPRFLELSAMTRLPWVTLHGMAHSFIELDTAVVHVINLVIFLWLWFSVCRPSDGEGLGTYGSFLMGETDWEGNWVLFWWVVGALFSKSLIQFSVDGWSCVPSLLFDWRPNYCEWSPQSCPTLCDPMDCSLPGSSLHGILQARVLEWVAISFSRGSSLLRDWTRVSCIPGRSFNLWATREASLCNSSFWGAMLQIVACCWPLKFFFIPALFLSPEAQFQLLCLSALFSKYGLIRPPTPSSLNPLHVVISV